MTLHHTALEAEPQHRQALVDFFGLLGFHEVERLPPGMEGLTRWVERDGRQVHFLFVEAGATAPPLGHLAIVCGDYDDTLDRLRAAGYDPQPQQEYWGSPRCFVRAPGDHVVEVMAFPPGAGA
jgi:catechol 2,3-dioxygenase-like lactoylglutathione lyase family enzyme